MLRSTKECLTISEGVALMQSNQRYGTFSTKSAREYRAGNGDYSHSKQ